MKYLITVQSGVSVVQDKIDSVNAPSALIAHALPETLIASNSRVTLVRDQSTIPAVALVDSSVPFQHQSTSVSMSMSQSPVLPLSMLLSAPSHPILVPSASAHTSGKRDKLTLHMT